MEHIRKYSPYLLVELLLPGGTLIAIALWILNRHREKRGLSLISLRRPLSK